MRKPRDVCPSATTIGQANAETASRGGTLAARVAGETRSLPARTGPESGSRILHVHFPARARAGPYPSGPLFGVGPSLGGRAPPVRSGAYVLLRSRHVRHHFRREGAIGQVGHATSYPCGQI